VLACPETMMPPVVSLRSPSTVYRCLGRRARHGRDDAWARAGGCSSLAKHSSEIRCGDERASRPKLPEQLCLVSRAGVLQRKLLHNCSSSAINVVYKHRSLQHLKSRGLS
jgi:hypothetical protein